MVDILVCYCNFLTSLSFLSTARHWPAQHLVTNSAMDKISGTQFVCPWTRRSGHELLTYTGTRPMTFQLSRQDGQLNVPLHQHFRVYVNWHRIVRATNKITLHVNIWQSNPICLSVCKIIPGDRSASGVGLRPFECWDWGFESSWGHVSCVCCVLCR